MEQNMETSFQSSQGFRIVECQVEKQMGHDMDTVAIGLHETITNDVLLGSLSSHGVGHLSYTLT